MSQSLFPGKERTEVNDMREITPSAPMLPAPPVTGGVQRGIARESAPAPSGAFLWFVSLRAQRNEHPPAGEPPAVPAVQTRYRSIHLLPVFNFLLCGQKKVAKKSRQGAGFRFPAPWTPTLKRLRGETVRGFPTLEPPFRGRETRDVRRGIRTDARVTQNPFRLHSGHLPYLLCRRDRSM